MFKQLSDGATQKDIVDGVLSRMQEIGLDVRDCSADNIERLRGEKLYDTKEMDINYYIGCYLNTLLRGELIKTNQMIPKAIQKEVNNAMTDGMICVYCSVVGHVLSTIIQPDVEAKFYIGYLDASWDLNFAKLLKIPPLNVASFHSIITLDGKILDTCYSYQNEGLNEIDNIIYGSYPAKTRMYGWDMLHAVNALIKYFASYNNLTTEEFMRGHIRFLKDLTEHHANEAIKNTL